MIAKRFCQSILFEVRGATVVALPRLLIDMNIPLDDVLAVQAMKLHALIIKTTPDMNGGAKFCLRKERPIRNFFELLVDLTLLNTAYLVLSNVPCHNLTEIKKKLIHRFLDSSSVAGHARKIEMF